ncbi:MAG: pilus assembly protein [Elusimicrobia bacterium]|nr:pilus assembly protein [Elusimicrobiota bacterium]
MRPRLEAWDREGVVSRPKAAGAGQVLVEVLLILPVFLFVVFTIMEIGFLAFHTILIHHAAYEAARVASLTASAHASATCSEPGLTGDYQAKVIGPMFQGTASASARKVKTLRDPQEGCWNYDVVIDVTRTVPMVFPMTGFVLGNTPDRRARVLTASVRMPIERPLFK